MKEFIEKLIGRLEEEKQYNPCRNTQCKECKYTNVCYEGEKCYKVGIDNIISIVNQLADEYKDKEYCWQECASTEHCKECSRLGNGDIDYFESIDDWAESLATIDAGELLGNSEQVK